VDVKTLLLLGAGMAVLSLVGFCSVQSRSAGLAEDARRGSSPRQSALNSLAGSTSAHQIDTNRFLMKGKVPAMPVGMNR